MYTILKYHLFVHQYHLVTFPVLHHTLHRLGSVVAYLCSFVYKEMGEGGGK